MRVCGSALHWLFEGVDIFAVIHTGGYAVIKRQGFSRGSCFPRGVLLSRAVGFHAHLLGLMAVDVDNLQRSLNQNAVL